MNATDTAAIALRRADRMSVLRGDVASMIAFCVLCAIVIFVAVGTALRPWLAPAPNLALRHLPPFSLAEGWAYVLGADSLGRAVLFRLAEGGASTLLIALAAVVISGVVGTTLGVLGAISRSWADSLVMRIADLISGFPSLLLAIIVIYAVGPSLPAVVAILAFTRIPVYMRVARAQTLEARSRSYVGVARTMGARPFWLMRAHLLPVVLPAVVTVATLEMANVMLVESALSFLGLGVQPPDVSWGLMIGNGREYLVRAWWLVTFPGLLIVAVTVSLSVLGNRLREVSDAR